MEKRFAVYLATAGLVAAALASFEACASDGGDFRVAVGFDYSTGKYGSANRTEIASVPFTGLYTAMPWEFRLTVPYASISGPGDVVVGGRRSRALAPPAPGTPSTTRSGLGDVVAAATYGAYSAADRDFGVGVTGRIKFATADPGLGTGENDYAVQADACRRFDRVTLWGALGFEVLGSPAGVEMNNVAYGILGGAYRLRDWTWLGAEMKLAQKASAIDAEQRELFLYASQRISHRLSIRGYVSSGLADGSPDSGFGVLVSSIL